MICGDMNFRDINWEDLSHNGSVGSEEFKFIEATRDAYMKQHIDKPTRGRGRVSPSLLDLIITRDDSDVTDIKIDSPIGKSDHAVISCRLLCNYVNITRTKTRYQYDKADYSEMKRVMDIDWKTEFEKCEDNVKEMWRVFTRKMHEAEKFIPKRTVKLNSNSSSNKNKYKRPLDRKSLCRIKRKSRLWEKYCQTNDGQVYLEYRKVSNRVRRITRKAQKVLEKNVAKQAKTNPKKFWQFVNNKTRARPNIPDLFVDEDTPTGSNVTTSSDKEKANILNQYFASVFTKEDALYDKVIPDRTECKLIDIDINEDMVKKKLLKLKVHKSKGLDGIHPRVLKELASVICVPLAIIFKTSIRSGTLPDEWKLANVTTIHKNGHRQMAGNYRPVSLTLVVCKV